MPQGDHSQVAPDAIRQGLLRPSTAEERECRSPVISVVILKVDFGDPLTGHFHVSRRDPLRANPEAGSLQRPLFGARAPSQRRSRITAQHFI